MRSEEHLLFLVASIAGASAPLSTSQHSPAKPSNTPLHYEVTVLPGSRAVFVRGRLEAPESRVNGWIAGASRLGDATRLPPGPSEFHFAYSVPLPEAAQSNSPDAEIDKARLRTWRKGIFLIPSMEAGEAGPIEVCVNAPQKWRIVTPAGEQRCFSVTGIDRLLSTPLVAGNFRVDQFRVGGARTVLAVREGHPVSPEHLKRVLGRLIEGASAYLETPPPSTVFFGIDRLEQGRKTHAPGNNETRPGLSSTLLIDSDAAPALRKYWGTYAHEYTHSWIPRAFGGPAVTREQLGSVFTEGFTDYLAYRIAHAAGVHQQQEFLAALSEFYLEYQEAVTRLPKGNPEFLRYRQGMMAAWMLDLELLKVTQGRAGFREFMQLLLKRHLNTDGITRDEVRDALRTLGGERVAALYDPLVDITQPIDFAAHLKSTGITLRPVQSYSAAIEQQTQVLGIAPGRRSEQRYLQRWLGG